MSVDPIFADPRLAAVYDTFDGTREDLDAYLALAVELGAGSVLDVGCGTGELALRLAAHGFDVVGADPAAASVAVARAKPGAERVRWVDAGAADLGAARPRTVVDLAVLAGNVAQVFLAEDEWHRVLSALHAVIRPGGHLVLETRRPERPVWQEWASRAPLVREVPGQGLVEQRFELLDVALPLVSLRWTYRFADGDQVSSDSTLVFRPLDQVTADLTDAGFDDVEVREAPDRPGLELVLLARRS